MINIAICDDNTAQLNDLKAMTEKICEYEHSILCFNEEDQFLNSILTDKIDIVLLDIKLKSDNGINVAKRLQTVKPEIIIVFISGYNDYFEDVYDVEHIYFLTKPIKEVKLKSALNKAYKMYVKQANKKIYIKGKSGITVIDMTKVMCFESMGRNITAHCEDGDIYIPGVKLSDLYKYINEEYHSGFVRCHQSFIIDINRAVKLKRGEIVIENYGEVPVSRRYYDQIVEKMVIAISGYL